jgi:hypothetical protein
VRDRHLLRGDDFDARQGGRRGRRRRRGRSPPRARRRYWRRCRRCGCVAVNATMGKVIDEGGARIAFSARLVVVMSVEAPWPTPASPRRVRRTAGRSTWAAVRHRGRGRLAHPAPRRYNHRNVLAGDSRPWPKCGKGAA